MGVVQYWFKTPNVVGNRHILSGVYAGGSQQARKVWLLEDTKGNTILSQNTQAFNIRLSVGDTKLYTTTLQPDTYYTLKVFNNCTRLPCDSFIFLNNNP